jgi:radical SAM superfamily enzyme YgiQ (UPF0313 family)
MADVDVVYLHPAKYGASLRASGDAPSIGPYPLMPVGIPGMMNLLRSAGLNVMGLNVFVETLLDLSFDLRRWMAKQPSPRLFAIDLHWYEHSYGALDVARACKQLHPRTPVVLGGLTASCFAREILADFAQVDYVIRGDGEQPLLQLALALCRQGKLNPAEIPNLTYRQRGQVLETPRTYCGASGDLDRLDFVDMDWLLHASEYLAVEYNGPKIATPVQGSPTATSSVVALGHAEAAPRRGHWLTIGRGCCFDCPFCGGGKEAHAALAGRQGIVPRSPARVADDMERLRGLGVKQASLNLDPAVMGKAYWSALFGELRRRQVGMGIYDELFQLPEDEFLDAFAEVAQPEHSELVFSPLSGSEDVRRLNGKRFSNQELLHALSRLKAYDMPVFIYFSLNLPGENERTFRQTLRLAEEIARLYPARILRMANMLHTVDPCSPMSRDPAAHGVKVTFKTFQDYYTYCRETPSARDNAPLGSWRGFEPESKAMRSLEQMARQWDGFCRGQRAECMPVPPVW